MYCEVYFHISNYLLLFHSPLEEHVSKWQFELEAMDKDGDSVSDEVEIVVQHHRHRRTVNFEFSLQLKIEKKYDFPSVVDWQLRLLNGLARLYGDPDTKHITVRAVSYNADPVVFTWTNDTLPKTTCPEDEIDKLYQVSNLFTSSSLLFT